ncbi:uncharacterized protein LOC18992202 [Eutrema salsugineum]|uniref:uncharacterized protein LOC18992202 n=1 Tax=Eutrema salsugineum TaxID=72664 RepID=UPI000CED4F7C|nr:uncharacterized protein LOC18992202 [Eutrema salsugineum]
MDWNDDIFDDQMFQLSPLCFTPSPDSFPPIMDVLQDPIVEETANVFDGLISNPVIGEANPSMNTQSPNLIPFPETLTLVQNPPEMEHQQLSGNSHGYFQDNLLNRQADQQPLFDQNLLDSFLQPDVSVMQPQQLSCNSHSFLQGNLPNGQLNQQSLFNQNTMSSFPEPNDPTMTGTGQQIEGEINGFAHPITTQSFELPNHLQEQFRPVSLSPNYQSYPTYQHGPVASHFNMYDQQPPPLVLTNREDELLAPRMVADLYGTYPQQNQISVTPPLPQIPSSCTRPRFCRNQGNAANAPELGTRPSPRFRYPTIETYAQFLPCTTALADMEISILGRRPRSHFEHGESSSSARRRRFSLPERNIDSNAANPVEERLQNSLYDPRYESLGLKIDPILRRFSGWPGKKGN